MKTFKTRQSEQGIALLIVISTIALLTWLLADFSFETNMNKMRVYNEQDKLRAKLNAQAGINFALAKLRLYKEARNLLEKNKNLKKIISTRTIEQAVLTPFVYPIPSLPTSSSLPPEEESEDRDRNENGDGKEQRTTILGFNESTLLEGSLLVSINPVKGFLNVNNLRFNPTPPKPLPSPPQNSLSKEKSDNDKNENENGEEHQKEDKKDSKSPQEYIEEKLLSTLQTSFNEKKEEDEAFEDLYGTLNPHLLIKELKFYVNHPDFFYDPEKVEIQNLYSERGTTPKHAPLTSLDELYLLEGWPDDIINLIKDRLTVHQARVISINELSDKQLQIIFPTLDDIQREEFFKYRDGDPELEEEPHPFKSEEGFKNYLIGSLGLSENIYKSRAEEFKTAGLHFGVAGSLYKVVSTGLFERSKYTLTAFIELPVDSSEEDTLSRSRSRKRETRRQRRRRREREKRARKRRERTRKYREKEGIIQFLDPRVVEIRVQ